MSAEHAWRHDLKLGKGLSSAICVTQNHTQTNNHTRYTRRLHYDPPVLHMWLLRACMPMLLQGQPTASLRPLDEGIAHLTADCSVSQSLTLPVRHQWWPCYLSAVQGLQRCHLTQRSVQPDAQPVTSVCGETMGPHVCTVLSELGAVSQLTQMIRHWNTLRNTGGAFGSFFTVHCVQTSLP